MVVIHIITVDSPNKYQESLHDMSNMTCLPFIVQLFLQKNGL